MNRFGFPRTDPKEKHPSTGLRQATSSKPLCQSISSVLVLMLEEYPQRQVPLTLLLKQERSRKLERIIAESSNGQTDMDTYDGSPKETDDSKRFEQEKKEKSA